MKMKKTIILLFAIVNILTAQKKNFTIEDVVVNSYSTLAPERIKQFKWLPGSDSYSFVKTEDTVTNLVVASVHSSQMQNIIPLNKINGKLTSNGLRTLSYFPRYSWFDKDIIYFINNKNLIYYFINKDSASIVNRVEPDASNINLAPNKRFMAYTVDNNLYVSLDTNKTKQITFDENPHIINGQTVHRNEFGITKGIFWSPKNNYIAFYRKDERMVTDFPIVDFEPVPAKLSAIKYPMAGQKSHHVTIGIYNIATGNTVWLKTGKPADQYLTCVTWDPGEKYIYVAHLNRDQNHMQLKKYDVATGEPVKVLFEEKNDKYVEPEHQLIFLPKEPDKFLWFSKRDGWNHLYLYDTDGNLIKQITKGNWEVLEFAGFDKTDTEIFIKSTEKSPVERHYYKINLRTGLRTKLTTESGVHRVIPNDAGTYFYDSFSSTKVPGLTKITDKDGKTITILLRSRNPLDGYNLGDLKIFTIDGENGVDLYCRMITPPDFDPNKKYPVIVYVYGGPHVQLVTNSWAYGRYGLWFYKMAQEGFVVFTLDNRGSANRGLEFEQATFRNLGTAEIEDQLRGIDYLKSLSFIDTNRIGVFGWSFGGFMTTSLMLRTNNVFKVGVAGGAVIDWKMYEVMYTERYMDTPQDNPEGYEKANLLNYVENLNGKLLLVHGTSDPVVVWQHTLKFAKKAADLNKPLDYFPYVGHKHGVVGKDAVHLYNKITRYFLDNL